jgi:hypothetical protein
MKRYKVYFTEAASKRRGMLIEKIFGYSEDDALLRAGIDRDEIEKIIETFL